MDPWSLSLPGTGLQGWVWEEPPPAHIPLEKWGNEKAALRPLGVWERPPRIRLPVGCPRGCAAWRVLMSSWRQLGSQLMWTGSCPQMSQRWSLSWSCQSLTLDEPGYLTPSSILSFTSLKGVGICGKSHPKATGQWQWLPMGGMTAGRLPRPEEIGGLGPVWISAPRASAFSHPTWGLENDAPRVLGQNWLWFCHPLSQFLWHNHCYHHQVTPERKTKDINL